MRSRSHLPSGRQGLPQVQYMGWRVHQSTRGSRLGFQGGRGRAQVWSRGWTPLGRREAWRGESDARRPSGGQSTRTERDSLKQVCPESDPVARRLPTIPRCDKDPKTSRVRFGEHGPTGDHGPTDRRQALLSCASCSAMQRQPLDWRRGMDGRLAPCERSCSSRQTTGRTTPVPRG